MTTDMILSLIFGLFGMFVVIAGTGGTILLIALKTANGVEARLMAALEAQRRECDEKIVLLREEMGKRIEALRIETKDDRHNYVDKIDGVLAEIREDVAILQKSVTAFVARMETTQEMRAAFGGKS